MICDIKRFSKTEGHQSCYFIIIHIKQDLVC